MRRARLLRYVRTGLVVGVNSILLGGQIVTKLETGAAQRVDPVRGFRADPVFFSDLIWGLPLALGIVLELTAYRPARWVNIGYYALSAVYLIAGFFLAQNHLLGLSEPEHWILAVIFMAVPSLLFACILWWLYRATAPGAAPETDAA